MPMWCPPTPPQNDNDLYIDYSLGFLYEQDIMQESQLPPIYVKKEFKRVRSDAGFYVEGRRPAKIRKEDNYNAPRSLFDRPSVAMSKIRKDLKLQRYRGIFKPNVQIPGFKQQISLKSISEPDGMPDWGIYEDIAILHCLQNIQGLPLNLMLLSPGHTPNWDLVAETVNLYSKTYRPPKHCRWRYEAIIVPREEGKLLESPKKQKKLKLASKATIKGGVKTLRTSQFFTADNNFSYTKLMKSRFDGIKAAYLKKAPPPKRKFSAPSAMNLKHAEVLCSFGINNYESPMSPTNIAMRKVEKIREKQKMGDKQDIIQQQQPQTQQQIQRTQYYTNKHSEIVVQQQDPQAIQQVTQILQGGQIQSRTISQSSSVSSGGIQVHHQPVTGQIVKAIVTPSSNIVTSGQPGQQMQIQPTSVGGMAPSTVSVVLTTPVSTLTGTQGSQLVSLQQPSSSISSSTSSIVQTIPSAQVVSMSQLTTVGTVLTTSANLQSSGNVTSNLRAQRIVTAPSGTIQEVVLQQRPSTQSPTIVSMSSLGQNVPQQQFQTTQLRFAMANQQIGSPGVKGLTAGTLQQTGKMSTNQPAQIQVYRQQASRQQFKILQTSTSQTGQTTAVVQTAGGQTTLVNAAGGTIGIVPTSQTVQVQGQKVSVAAVSQGGSVVNSSGVVTSVATVQVAPGQNRAQFLKQVGVGVGQKRQGSDNEMLLVKRQVVGQQKQQIIPQSQIFAQSNVQQTAAGTSGQQQQQQQIATLVKTSTGNITTTGGTVNMLSQLKPSGQIKVTMANQTQMRNIQIQQQLLAHQRKVGKMTQLVQQKSGQPTQLIVQNPKNIPGSVTVQQIQQVIRHAQPGTIQTAGGQIVLGKTRVIPVSLASQPNSRQAIQVVSGSSTQALQSGGNIRTHVTGTQNISGTIKVATSSGNQSQAQQSLQQQQQRQNASPVRLQTSSGNLVTVVQHLVQTQAGGSVDLQSLPQVQTISTQQVQQQTQSQANQQVQQQQTPQQQPQK